MNLQLPATYCHLLKEDNEPLDKRSCERQNSYARKCFCVLLVLMISLLGLPSLVTAQATLPKSLLVNSPGITDYVLPSNLADMYITVTGAQGGSTTYSCQFQGGHGAVISTLFFADFCSPHGILPGGTIRLIVGGQGESAQIQERYAGGGGGGSALLYKAPGSDTWTILVVSGGGGGAGYSDLLGGGCEGNGHDGLSSQLTTQGGLSNGGTNGNGGSGSGLYSYGGGGAFSDGVTAGNQGCNGKAGFPNGGAEANCNDDLTTHGGFGFGSGGGGYSGGGGGGGYSGGGGAAVASNSGGGGGSYLVTWAPLLNSLLSTGPPTGDGEISIFCDFGSIPHPVSLQSATLPGLQVPGCDINNSVGFGYSTIEKTITLSQFNAAGGVITSGGCGIQSISYIDVTDPNNRIVNRTYTITDTGSTKVTCKQIITIVDPGIAATISPAAQTICINTTPAAITVDAAAQFGITIQWSKGSDASFVDADVIPDATSLSYTPPPSATADFTYYFAKITDNCGTITIKRATVGVLAQAITWYKDADNDGYSDGTTKTQCSQPDGYKQATDLTAITGDCNDDDPAINPATEWYLDADNDGYYTSLQIGARVQCESPGQGWKYTGLLGGGDCNDNDPAINPATIWYLDADNDGYHDKLYTGTPSCTPPLDGRHYITTTKGPDCNDNDATYNPETVWVIDQDGDGYYTGTPYTGCLFIGANPGYVRKTNQLPGDCDDNDPAVNPQTVWVLDADGDGYYTGSPVTSCTIPGTGYVIKTNQQAGDCDDNNISINPATVWYKDSDNDGYSDGSTVTQCTRPTGGKLASELMATSGDCNDNDAAINPTTTWLFDYDNDGYYSGEYIGVASCTAPGPGWKPASSFTKGVDCDDNDPLVTTGKVWYKDADNDGYSDGATKTQCDQPAEYKLAADLTATSGDCNDNDATVNPQTVWVLDADNDGYYVGTPVTQCSSPGTGYVILTTQIAGDCNDNDANVHTSATISIQPGITTCAGSKATITASSSATNPTYSWYADAAGQTLLQQSTSASFTTPVLSGNTIFYVSVADGSAGCTSVLTPAPVTVNPLPVVAPITYSGSTTVCGGITGVQLTESTTGGSWSASNNAASVTGAGVVTFATVTATTSVTIYYTLTTNGCSNKVGLPFTVSPSMILPAITGNTAICGINANTTLSDATGGGTWSSNNLAIATVNNSTGVVTGKSTGSATITYTLSSGCTASVSTSVSVNTLPAVAAISGASVLIKGTSVTLADATKGGTWSSSNTAIATVSTGGSVKGIANGTCTIYYTVTSGGCSVVASKPVTVYNPLTASVTSGKIPCNGSSTTLTINVTGGSGGYQYSLNGGKFQTSNTYTVYAGTYLVVVKDNMAEQFTISGIIIGQPAALGLRLVSETNASSKTATNGAFTVSGSGGTPAYQYSKNGGSTYQTSGTFSSLAPGTYKVSVKDNCVTLSNKLSVIVGYNNHLSVSEEAIPQIDNGDEIVATVSPNPTETEFTLRLSGNNTKQVELRVIDMYGRSVYHTTGSANQSYKFGEKFTSGVYIIEILHGKILKNLKVIKGK